MLTNGGRGVGLFVPFNPTRYFFPWRPIEVSPIGVREFLSARGLTILLSELKWVWLPSAVVLLTGYIVRRYR
jgi:inner membrane protein